MKHQPATPRFTAQELFDAVNADPRVKAYPRLVAVLNEIISAGFCGAEDSTQKDARANARALLRELVEVYPQRLTDRRI